MSSKTASDARGARTWWRPRSIALRIVVWYVLSAFALIFFATSALYQVLVSGLAQEDTRNLRDYMNTARLWLQSQPNPSVPTDRNVPSLMQRERAEIYIRLLAPNGAVLFETPGMSSEVPAPTQAELASLTVADQAQQILSQSQRPFLLHSMRVLVADAAKPVGFVQGAMDLTYDEEQLVKYRERLYLVLGTSLILCAILGYFIAKGGMRPLNSIGQTAERIRSSTLHERIDLKGLPSELSGLANTFNVMLDRLADSFARISEFSDDVAHELRTPVNNLRGEIEVALSKARTSEDYREVLGSCLEECNRLSRIIHSLLFLARTENDQHALQLEDVPVRETLEAVRDFYEPASTEAGVTLSVIAPSDLSARLDRTLCRQAVSNLVSNALGHTGSGGTVELRAESQGPWINLTVTDTGSGIPPEHLPHVFDRLYRADKARAGSTHNAGLGLAIVKSIALRHGGYVDIQSQVGRGTEVALTLPRSLGSPAHR